MVKRYKVYPVPTPNLILHSDRVYQNYALTLENGEMVDVRTRQIKGRQIEILLAQVTTLSGKVLRQLEPDQIELASQDRFHEIEP